MLQRLYVHNFRCLENWELITKEMPSALLIGKNGSGKSTIPLVIETLQRIARGKNRVGELIQSKDFARGRSDVPMRLEMEVLLDEKLYKYVPALELPERFRELRVAEVRLFRLRQDLRSRYEEISPLDLVNKVVHRQGSFSFK